MRNYFIFLILILAMYGCQKESSSSYPGYPVDSFTGVYHITGKVSIWYLTLQNNTAVQVTQSSSIDTIITVSKDNVSNLTTTYLPSESYSYSPTSGPDSVHNYYFGDYNVISFRRPYNDSIFFNGSTAHIDNGSNTQWQGVKIQ